ncbi:MAG: hypothetical protein AAF730_10420 [Bacteroidota bacterium]
MSLPTLFIVLALHLAPVSPPQNAVAVVVHPDTPVEQLSDDDLLRIYLMEQTFWNDGTAIQIVDLRGNDESKSTFYDALGLQPRNLFQHQMRLVFAGEATSPEKVANPAAMLRGVAETPGAIGYLPADVVDDRVTVVAYLPR